MSRGSGAGLIRVGNLGGKTIATITSATQSSPDLLEAFGFRNYTFMLDSAGSPTGTVDIQGTLDNSTAQGTGGTNWFKIGTLNPAVAGQNQVIYDKPLRAVRVDGTNYGSGTFTVLALCVP